MNISKNVLFSILMILLCIALFLERLTGKHVHALLGIILLIICLVHIYKKRNLLKYSKNKNFVYDMLLGILFLICSVTGIMLCPLGEVMAIKIVHKLTSLIFLILMIKHIVYYRKKTYRKKK